MDHDVILAEDELKRLGYNAPMLARDIASGKITVTFLDGKTVLLVDSEQPPPTPVQTEPPARVDDALVGHPKPAVKDESANPKPLPVIVPDGWATLREASGLLNRSMSNMLWLIENHRLTMQVVEKRRLVSRASIRLFRASVGFEGVCR